MTTVSPIVQDLINRRRELGLRHGDVAERMRRDAGAISRWERGVTDPSLRNLENWCFALGTQLRTGVSAAEKVERNRQIIAAIKAGRRSGEIAREFGVSRRTVTYLRSGKGWRPAKKRSVDSCLRTEANHLIGNAREI